eukprot:XP_001702408.1 ribulose-1,5-bisphosphate carboxylase/oxygenase small subunit 2 [Chlamydomonas reinhardtii]
MAAVIAKSSVSAAVARPARSSVRPMAALKPAVKAAPVAAPAQANQMMVWTPVNNKMFETFSYLPPLSDEQIAAQVDYIVANGWIPCLEFAESDKAYVSNESAIRFGSVSCRQPLLDHVEAAHVRLPRPHAGAARDRRLHQGLPRCLRAPGGLRQPEAGADHGLPGPAPQVCPRLAARQQALRVNGGAR